MIEGVLFDFFGTLVNYTAGRTTQDFGSTHQLLKEITDGVSYDDMIGAFDRIFAGLEARTKDTLEEFSMQEAVRQFLDEIGQPHDDVFIDEFTWRYIRDWQQHVEHLDGLSPYLRNLARKYRLGIITNTHFAPMIDDLLDTMGVQDLFESVVTSIEFGRPKPHPDIFQHALETMALDPTRAVYVGDSFDADYRGATGVGIGCYLIGRHARVPPARQIPSVFDLPTRLG